MKSKFLSVLSCGVCLLLCSCFFSSREVTVGASSTSDMQSYTYDTVYSDNGLTFASNNFLRGNMLQDDLTKDPVNTLQKLQEYFTISSDPKYMMIAADLCRWLALRSDSETAIRYHLSALDYSCQAFSAIRASSQKKMSPFDSSAFSLMMIYNEACSGVFNYLKTHDLLYASGFNVTGIDGKRFVFEKPVFRLSVPQDAVTEYSLCASYDIRNLRQLNRQIGVGVPLVARIDNRSLSKTLRTPAGLTIPVTMGIKIIENADHSRSLTPRYMDTSMSETMAMDIDPSTTFPLALDFSTPLACFLDSLPERNLISVMLDAVGEEKNRGLYMTEPYNPHKIPVVFIHGLMSSPETWIQMINSLKNDPVIRARYQFWFFYYSSGSPVMVTGNCLRQTLLEAQKEYCTTPEATANFNKMVLVGHSMGGLVTRLQLQKSPYYLMETATGHKWDELQKKLPPDMRAFLEKEGVCPTLPFVHRVIFLAVPHRGSKMAQMSIARFGTMITKLPEKLLKRVVRIKQIMAQIGVDDAELAKIHKSYFTGIDNLDPENPFVKVLGSSPIKDDVIYHSIIGDHNADGRLGGSDGVVPYWSSHLDGAASELVVESGHSVHRSPAAIQEVLRILRLHLQEAK